MKNTENNIQIDYSPSTKQAVGTFMKWFLAILAAFCMAIGIVNAFVPSTDAELKAELDARASIANSYNSSKKGLCDNESAIAIHILESQKDSLNPAQKQCYAQKAQWTCPADYDDTLNCSNLK